MMRARRLKTRMQRLMIKVRKAGQSPSSSELRYHQAQEIKFKSRDYTTNLYDEVLHHLESRRTSPVSLTCEYSVNCKLLQKLPKRMFILKELPGAIHGCRQMPKVFGL